MPYRFNGVECDTVEELRALTGYPMNQVLASNNFVPEVKVQSDKTKKRMKNHNPMHRAEIRDRAGVTWEDIDRGTHSEFGPK